MQGITFKDNYNVSWSSGRWQVIRSLHFDWESFEGSLRTCHWAPQAAKVETLRDVRLLFPSSKIKAMLYIDTPLNSS